MNKYLILIVCMMFFYSCSEENNRAPMIDDTTIPGQVSKVRVERLPGAVKLTYDMPEGQSLSYVKAECLINGVVRQAKASSYVNHLTIEGFADSSVYTVNLYSVNRSEKASEPVPVQVKPLSPPFRDVFKNMDLVDDWGGVTVFFENPNEADLAIVIIRADDNGLWGQGESFYTKRIEGSVSTRGLESKEAKFGAYVRDRWNNTSDTLVKVLTPRFEKKLDKSKFRQVDLPGDAPNYSNPPIIFQIWDEQYNGDPSLITMFGGWPQWVNFDTGCLQGAKFSRLKLWQRGPGYLEYAYDDRNIRKFEIWGSMDPNPDGSWESWTLLMDAEMIKPSGLPLGQTSDEDMQVFYDGHDFTFPLDVSFVRYVRIKVKETWSKLERFHLVQITLWGHEPSDL